MRTTRNLLVIGGLTAIILSAHGAANAKIDGVKFGEVLAGPKLAPADLKGHVVLIELWGLH